jgi:predicted DNA-binding transcriptional regulator YafY
MAKGQGRSENQRLKLLYLRDYLLENTDENNSVTIKQITNSLKDRFNQKIAVERKTVYTDFDMLEDYGMDIDRDLEKGQYKLLSRDFALYELQLLVDSVQSSKFITQKIAKEITDKLKRLASRHDRKTLENRSNYVVNRIRSMNDSVFYHIDAIHECIADDKKLTFRYFTYTVEKKKSYMKKGEKYTVSPFALLWNDNNYYLLAYDGGKSIKHFRVDKMDNIKPLAEPRDGKDVFAALNLSERSAKVFSMFGGREERVTLRFRNHLTGVVIDRFGTEILMLKDGEQHFTVSVAVEVSPQFFAWLCGLGRAVRIISPDSVVKEMCGYVANITEMYQTSTKT